MIPFPVVKHHGTESTKPTDMFGNPELVLRAKLCSRHGHCCPINIIKSGVGHLLFPYHEVFLQLLFGDEMSDHGAWVRSKLGACDIALPAFVGKGGGYLRLGLLLDEEKEAVLGGPIHLDVQLFGAGKLGMRCPVIKVAVDMFKVDSDGEAGLNCADGTD